MSEAMYREACKRERLEECERLLKQLTRIGWDNLAPRGRGVLEALRWATGETDEPPFPIEEEE